MDTMHGLRDNYSFTLLLSSHPRLLSMFFCVYGFHVVQPFDMLHY